MVKLLRGFAYAWGTLLGLSIVVGAIGIGWKDGIWKMWQIMSPFNLMNYIVIIVLALPAYGATRLADRLARRRT